MAEFPPPSLQPLIQEIFDLLKARNETVSVAETVRTPSCLYTVYLLSPSRVKPNILISSYQAAGGLISASLLSTPGASSIYKGGLTVYTLESRLAFAGWTSANIEKYKGPTTEIVANMADHTRQTLGSTYAISESGTAGPTGGTTRNRTP